MQKIKALFFLIILSLVSTDTLADLKTDRSVNRNDGTHRIVATARFLEPVTGDLYIATQVNGELRFIIEGGAFSLEPVPFRPNDVFSEDIPVLDLSGQGIPPGRYPLFKVVTQPGTDPLDFRNWVGGLNGLSRINFIIGLPVNESLDHDDDGFPDDDLNRDGYHDDDDDRDGHHDDDLDRDGFHDDDLDRDGFSDDDDQFEDDQFEDDQFEDDQFEDEGDDNF